LYRDRDAPYYSDTVNTNSLPNEDTDVAHTGPGTIAGRYLRCFWLPVAELTDVAPGRAKSIQILGENFTLFRGQSGDPHLLGYFCAHRNTPLFTGRVEGDCLRCFYHGWSYDGTGQCVDQPVEDVSFARKVRVAGYPTRSYNGLVFAYLGDGEPPRFPELDRFSLPGMNSCDSYVRKTNYFNSLENSVDYTHPFFVHMRSEFTGIGVNREIPKVDAEETAYGILGKKCYSDGKMTFNHILMPAAALITVVEGSTTIEHLAWRVPIDDYSHRTFILHHADLFGEEAEQFLAMRAERRAAMKALPPAADIVAAVFRGEVQIDDVDESRPDIIGIQDTVAMQLQPPIGERPVDRLGRGDFAVILLRKIFSRELRALANGEPLKAWHWPHDLQPKLNVAEVAG
jgi:5,5'-dehydrodivanillate O-demethylase oxygenase subunit